MKQTLLWKVLKGMCSGSSAGSEWRQALFLLKPPVQLTMGVVAKCVARLQAKGPFSCGRVKTDVWTIYMHGIN